jgi:hypothetical protein
MAISIAPWAIKAVEMLIRGFLWCGTEVASGGHCMVAWVNVTCPTRFGGLGLPDLRTFGMALRPRWLWLVRTDPDNTWAMFRFPTDRSAQAFFTLQSRLRSGMALGPCFGRTTGSLVVPSNSLHLTCGRLFHHGSGAHALSRRDSVRDLVGSIGSLILRTRGPCKSSPSSFPFGTLYGS